MEEILNHNLIKIGDYSLATGKLIAIGAIIIAIWIFLKILGIIMRRNRLLRIRKSRQYAIYQINKYIAILIATIISLNLLGVDVKVMLAGSAALLVGVGLGLQNLFNDFVSGVIILLDSSVRVNDIIELNGLFCKVQKINIRTTTVLTRDDKNIILPNSTLTSNQLINWTHSHTTSRFEIQVGVDYSSDIPLAMKLMREAALAHPQVIKDPGPYIRLFDFGNSSIDLALLFWSDEIFRVENIKSEIRIKIYDSFRQKGITIPFPQRVVHINNK